MTTLLLELFSEEIPARFQAVASASLRESLTSALTSSGLSYGSVRSYWTPRRLVIEIDDIPVSSSDVNEERKGPRVDAPTKAVEGFVRSSGLASIDAAEIRSDKKGDYYVAVISRSGRPTPEILGEIIPDLIRNFSWSKSMRWGEASSRSGSLRWVRPLQSIMCVFGDASKLAKVDFEVDGICSGDVTYGHRFCSSSALRVRTRDDYFGLLREAYVIVDPDERKRIILDGVRECAKSKRLELVEDDYLLNEVTNLVEWPVVLSGEFNSNFLDIPDEVIRLTIRSNQKCFVLRDGEGLSNHFVFVSNIEASDGGTEVIRGNERVINARLSDAQFFWESDLRTVEQNGFDLWREKLDGVTFHAKIGSQGERVNRIAKLAEKIASKIGADKKQAKRAAEICKADLASAMVGEFPDLQGVMGHYYAKHLKEDESVALACVEHYKPRGPSDDVPTDPVSIAVALADKLDMLDQFWKIDEKPTGSKDPYALRRAALGIIRLIEKNELRIVLSDFIYSYSKDISVHDYNDLLLFFYHRLEVYLRDLGYRSDFVAAVIANVRFDILEIFKLANALNKFLNTSNGKTVLAASKRAANILSDVLDKDLPVEEQLSLIDKWDDVNPDLFELDAEKELYEPFVEVEQDVDLAFEDENYTLALRHLSKLDKLLDRYFDEVMVNVEDEKVRNNRYAFIMRIRKLTFSFANFSKIQD